MPFNSFQYFLFLPVVYLVFYFVGDRVRWFVLLVASLLFYAGLNVPDLLIILMLVVITTYGFGIGINRASTPRIKLSMLWGGIAVNVLILVIIKYLPFLSENLKLFSAFFSIHKVFFAIGVSYYVFQAISYLIDIYLDIIKPERHFGFFALHMAFFPKLLQGPIERAGNLLPQLKIKYEFSYDNLRFGALLFTWGLFKKLVIADRLGLYVDTVYNNVHNFSGLPLLLATYAYSFQIYLDFSGYTDMALGSALLFNIHLTQNFNSPYLATSVADFWRRWHISFSSWILDYIFKPLQMHWRNWKNWGTAAALMVTFLVSGIWHGASWGFVIWGLLHGVYLTCSVFYRPYQKKLHKTLGIEKSWFFLKTCQIFVTFNLVSFAWIFFRANNLREALYVVSNICNDWTGIGLESLLSQGDLELFILITALILFTIVSAKANGLKERFLNLAIFRWTIYYCLALSIIIFSVRTKATFIYLGF